MTRFSGSIVAIVTPMNDDGSLDIAGATAPDVIVAAAPPSIAHATAPPNPASTLLVNVALAGAPGALDELHDAHPEAVADGAEDHAEGGGGFSLALAGVDDEQPALLGLGGEDLVARLLLLFHLFGVIGVALRLGHQVGLFRGAVGGLVGHR